MERYSGFSIASSGYDLKKGDSFTYEVQEYDEIANAKEHDEIIGRVIAVTNEGAELTIQWIASGEIEYGKPKSEVEKHVTSLYRDLD